MSRRETIDSIDLTEAREHTVKLILDTGEVLKEYFASKRFSVEGEAEKVVTEVDSKTEIMIKESLLRKYPQTTFLGEETTPESYPEWKSKKDLWVIDPIDGTINFSRGNPHFAISVALITEGKPVLGIIHLPILGKTFWAQADVVGAFCNGKLVEVSKTSDLTHAVLDLDATWEGREKLLGVMQKLSFVGRLHVVGSAVTALSYTASGVNDAYLHYTLRPWDVAAAGIIVRHVGGIVTTADGEDWNVFEPTILASNLQLHPKILAYIRT